jgi:hypothetical protein
LEESRETSPLKKSSDDIKRPHAKSKCFEEVYELEKSLGQVVFNILFCFVVYKMENEVFIKIAIGLPNIFSPYWKKKTIFMKKTCFFC